MRQPEAWLGDLIRLQASLGPLGPEALAASAELLGISRTPGGKCDRRKEDDPPVKPPLKRDHVAPPRHPPGDPRDPEIQRLRRLVLVRAERAEDGQPVVAEPITGLLDGPLPASLLPPPLFRPREQRAILSAASATPDEIGSPDVPRAIDELARGLPLSRVPRRPVATLRRGAQVLVDVSESMVPFHDDAGELVRALREVVGIDEMEVEFFSACPWRGAGSGPRRRWVEWVPRVRHRPVIVVTDLGIGPAPPGEPRARVHEWLAFAAQARVAGTDVLVLVPYPPARWPAQLRGELAIAQWDRTCRVSDLICIRERWRRR